MNLKPGTRLGEYEIVGLLGAGGMGEVYRARDLRLARIVAIKILGGLSSDPERRRRFEQEARATAALNHPNILAIFQFGDYQGNPYIVSELLEGQTLRESMREGPMQVRKVLTIGEQVAAGLSAAHAKGIVHRDLKPENLFLIKDGHIKILDFGLAKVQPSSSGSDDSTLSKGTEPGVIMGTVGYMSPEQVRGLEADHRTDIFALGTILYEALAGRPAFSKTTAADTMSSILREEPPPLTAEIAGLPPALSHIVFRCLEKKTEQRFQSAADLAFALRALSDVSGPVRETSSSSSHWTRRRLMAVAAIATALVLSLTWLVLYRKPATSSQDSMQMTRLTGSGRAHVATISPDGRYVAYSLFSRVGQKSIVLRHIPTERELTIVSEASGVIGLTFSNDSNYLYYVNQPETANTGTLYRVSIIGGDSQELVKHVDSGVGFSPDGRRMAYLRDDPNSGMSYLLLASSDGSQEHAILSRKRLDLDMFVSDNGTPMWSPDGQTLALPIRVPGMGHSDIMTVSTKGGEPNVVCDGWWVVDSVLWRNSSELILNGSRNGFSVNQLWSVSYPGCSFHRITNDTNSYVGLSATANLDSLLTIQQAVSASLWMLGSHGDTRQIGQSPGAEEGRHGLAWMKDGTVLYTYKISGYWGLATTASDGSRVRQLSLGSSSYTYPAVSPDGKTIAVVSDREGPPSRIWRMSLDGSAPKRLSSSFGVHPTFSNDGKWVFFFGRKDGTYGLQKVPLEGGVQQFVDQKSAAPIGVSSDSKLVASIELNDNGSSWRVVFVPVDGGPPTKFSSWIGDLQQSIPGLEDAPIRLSLDQKQVIYVASKSGSENLWSHDLSGGKVTQLSHFTDAQHIFWFEIGVDGRIAVSRGTGSSDIVLIRKPG